MTNSLLAIAFALASALTIAWGTVVRHRIVKAAPLDGTIDGSPLMAAARNPLWWAGLTTALLGYALQIVALSFGALLIVQPVLVLSLMFTMLLAARMQNRALSRFEIMWAITLSAAVTLLLLVGRPTAGTEGASLFRWIGSIVIGGVVLVSMAWFAGTQPTRRKALVLGLVTGALFGYVAVLSKAFVDIATSEGVLGAITSWETYGLILGATVGTAVQQYSFHAGPLEQSLPAMTIGEPIVAFTLGYVVLGERFQVESLLGWMVLAASVAAMIAATWQLSQPSRKVTATP